MQRLSSCPHAILGWKHEVEMVAAIKSLATKPMYFTGGSRWDEEMERDSIARMITAEFISGGKSPMVIYSTLRTTLDRTCNAVVMYLDWVDQPYTRSLDTITMEIDGVANILRFELNDQA